MLSIIKRTPNLDRYTTAPCVECNPSFNDYGAVLRHPDFGLALDSALRLQAEEEERQKAERQAWHNERVIQQNRKAQATLQGLIGSNPALALARFAAGRVDDFYRSREVRYDVAMIMLPYWTTTAADTAGHKDSLEQRLEWDVRILLYRAETCPGTGEQKGWAGVEDSAWFVDATSIERLAVGSLETVNPFRLGVPASATGSVGIRRDQPGFFVARVWLGYEEESGREYDPEPVALVDYKNFLPNDLPPGNALQAMASSQGWDALREYNEMDVCAQPRLERGEEWEWNFGQTYLTATEARERTQLQQQLSSTTHSDGPFPGSVDTVSVSLTPSSAFAANAETGIGKAPVDSPAGLPVPVSVDLPMTWQEAETRACLWMSENGYTGARVTPPGTDGGIDVLADTAIAQVKHHAKPVGLSEIQRLLGIATAMKQEALFFSSGGYTAQAQLWAIRHGVRLFHFTAT